jgi:hypothetical protein
MKLGQWLENWGMTGLSINLGILHTEWAPQEEDREAAWELYVELLTRVVTQPLPESAGDERAALDSAHQLFGITRGILRAKGRRCVQFTKLAVIVLNQIVRPFTAKWHRLASAGAFEQEANRREFRRELAALQGQLAIYARMLADIAQVEDLTASRPSPG